MAGTQEQTEEALTHIEKHRRMERYLLFLSATLLLVCGCGGSEVESAAFSNGQPTSVFVGRYTGQDLGQPGQLDLAIDATGKVTGSYLASANHNLVAPGNYPLSGQVEPGTGFFRLLTSQQADLQLQGRLPTADGADQDFSLHAAGKHSGGIFVKGASSAGSGTFEGAVTLSIDVQNSNAAPLNNPRVAALLRSGPGAVNEYLTVQISDYTQEARMLTLRVNSGTSPLATGKYPLISAEPTRPLGFYATLNEGRPGSYRTWVSSPSSPGELTITTLTANRIDASFSVSSVQGEASSGATGSFACSGTFSLRR